MEAEKEYVNKDLYNIGYEKFCKDTENDFVGDDIIEQLEWALMITQGKFKQIKSSGYIKELTINHFDKSFLISSSFGRMTLNFSRFLMTFKLIQKSSHLLTLRF